MLEQERRQQAVRVEQERRLRALQGLVEVRLKAVLELPLDKRLRALLQVHKVLQQLSLQPEQAGCPSGSRGSVSPS